MISTVKLLAVLSMLSMLGIADSGDDAPIAPYVKKTLIAHRGASGDFPEHTILAYQKAIEQKADFVEPDLQITRDGELICMHDATLERTTNVEEVFPDRSVKVKDKKVWPVVNFTLAEIKRLDAGAWRGKAFAGLQVPTFQEFIDLTKGKVGIIPETKSPEAYLQSGHDMNQLLMTALKKNHLASPNQNIRTPVIIQSFSQESLVNLRSTHQCQLPLVFLIRKLDEHKLEEELDAIKRVADGIAPSKSLLMQHPKLIDLARKRRMSVTVWTFREGQTAPYQNVTDEMRHFLSTLRVDAVFTDHPDRYPHDLAK